MTVVIFSTGTELFVRLISEVDSLPMVAGRSVVVGVCASAMSKLFDTPIIESIIVKVIITEIRSTVFMPLLNVYYSIKYPSTFKKKIIQHHTSCHEIPVFTMINSERSYL